MKKQHNVFWLIGILMIVSACSEMERVEIHHDPYLNIYANVTVDDPSKNYVNVYHTTGYGEPDYYEIDSIIYHQFYNESSGDTITYQTLYMDTSYAVNNANVYFLHLGDTIRFYERIQGVYELVDTNVSIVSGDEYQLYVETDDFGIATGTEEALSPISWIYPAADTMWVSISQPADTLKWNDISSAYNVKFDLYYSDRWGSYTYEFMTEQVRDPFWVYDSSRYSGLFDFNRIYEYLYSDYYPDTLALEVRVIAYSDSYLDYLSLESMQLTTGFIRYPTINDFRVNIDNALGAFTSMSISDQRMVMFVK